MLILTAAQNTQPDYVALAMVLVLAIVVATMAIRKRFFTKTKEPEPVVTSVSVTSRFYNTERELYQLSFFDSLMLPGGTANGNENE